jgi:putative ABC transport system permease protein
MGRGAIVIGLAAIIIGEVLAELFFPKGCQFFVRLLFVIIGGIVYYLIMILVLWMHIDSNDLKLATAIIVMLALAIPNLRKRSQ